MGNKIEHPYRVDLWPPGDAPVNIGTHDRLDDARAAFARACADHPGAEITLRHGARVIEKQRPAPK